MGPRLTNYAGRCQLVIALLAWQPQPELAPATLQVSLSRRASPPPDHLSCNASAMHARGWQRCLLLVRVRKPSVRDRLARQNGRIARQAATELEPGPFASTGSALFSRLQTDGRTDPRTDGRTRGRTGHVGLSLVSGLQTRAYKTMRNSYTGSQLNI